MVTHPKLATPEQSRTDLRRKLLHDVLCGLLAETILLAAAGAAGYGLHHVAITPPADTVVEHLGQIAIVVGAVGLGVPVLVTALVLVHTALGTIHEHHAAVLRLDLAPVQGVRLGPSHRTYRG